MANLYEGMEGCLSVDLKEPAIKEGARIFEIAV